MWRLLFTLAGAATMAIDSLVERDASHGVLLACWSKVRKLVQAVAAIDVNLLETHARQGPALISVQFHSGLAWCGCAGPYLIMHHARTLSALRLRLAADMDPTAEKAMALRTINAVNNTLRNHLSLGLKVRRVPQQCRTSSMLQNEPISSLIWSTIGASVLSSTKQMPTPSYPLTSARKSSFWLPQP